MAQEVVVTVAVIAEQLATTVTPAGAAAMDDSPPAVTFRQQLRPWFCCSGRLRGPVLPVGANNYRAGEPHFTDVQSRTLAGSWFGRDHGHVPDQLRGMEDISNCTVTSRNA